jgi:hypothetical protein
MKRRMTIVAVLSILLCGLTMAIRGKEGEVKAMHANLFTASGGHKLQYATWVFPKRPWKEISSDSSFFSGERKHYGFPFWALYVDRSIDDKSWYAKLDLAVLCVNYLACLIPSFILVFSIKRKKSSTTQVQFTG